MDERTKRVTSVETLTSVLGTTPEIPYEGVAGMIHIPSAAVLTFYGSDSEDDGGTYTVLRRRDSADTDYTTWDDVTLTATAAGWHRMPDQCLAFRRLKITVAAGTLNIQIAGTT